MKIISGGQTGVDRGALDAAIALGVPHGGWCPKGRMAEDGKVPAKYLLEEAQVGGYIARTVFNVRDSDGTLILHTGKLGPGTRETRRLALFLKKPLLEFSLQRDLPFDIYQWVRIHRIETMNVAGGRESRNPGLQAKAAVVMTQALNLLAVPQS